MKKKNLVLTGGGTAGHVWPHFAIFEAKNSPLAKEFCSGHLDVHYIGSHSGIEKNIVMTAQPSWHYHSVATGKLRRYFSLMNFIEPFSILYGFLQAVLILKKIHATAVFSKGGFVAAPVVWAAWLCRIPVVIHESDVTPALATRLTIPFARLILISFEETQKHLPGLFRKKVEMVGLPVRETLFSASRDEALKFFSFSSNRKTILIFGGSLGAKSLNQKMLQVIPELHKKYNIVHIVGRGNLVDKNGLQDYRQFEFLVDEMKYAYAVADLAVCRAGASSLFELSAARIPMILFPLGLHASRGDQIQNASVFVLRGWAQCVNESQFETIKFLSLIDSMVEDLEGYKNALSNSPARDSSACVAQLLWNILKNDRI